MKTITFDKDLMEKYGDIIHKELNKRWTVKQVLYRLDWLSAFRLWRLELWLRKQTGDPAPELVALVKKQGWAKLESDDAIIKILKWVHDNCTYITDQAKYGVAEKWQTAIETFNLKTGDCEDGCILIYVLANLSGISDDQLRVTAGNVTRPGSNTLEGHCYLKYRPNFMVSIMDNLWKIMDWCWFYDSTLVHRRKWSIELNTYKDVWFEVNSNRYFGRYQLK